MFCLDTILHNIIRHKTKSIINMGICIFAVFLLNIYLGNIESNHKQLVSLPEAIPVYCRIVNLNGSKESGLEIQEDLLDKLQNSSYVKDEKFTNTLIAGEGDFVIEDWEENLNIPVISTTSIGAISGLTQELITFKEGMDTDFLQYATPSCIVDKELMKERNWKIGDKIQLTLYYYMHVNNYQVNCRPLELLDFEIIGSMENFVGEVGQMGLKPNIIIPLATVKESYHRMDIPFSADSASFYVADSLKLNEFKEEMQSFGLLNRVAEADESYKGNALIVRDSMFISSASKLQQSSAILSGFLPIIFVTIIFVGYITSSLLIDSRQTEFAIMRSLGMSFFLCFRILFIEQLILVMAGELIGSILSYIFYRDIKVAAIVSGIFLITYLLGSTVAIWRFGRKSVMEVLFQTN